MPQAKKPSSRASRSRTTRRKSASSRTTRSSTGQASVRRQAERSIKRLEKSLGDAQDAITALGKDLGRGGRDLYKDTSTMLRSARRDAVKANRRALKDLDALQTALRGSGPRAKRSAAARSSAARKGRSTTRRRSTRS